MLLNYDKSKSQYNFNDATVKADVLKAFGGRLGYELKQVFAKKKRAGATSLLLKLTSPEVSGCEVQAEYDAMGRSLHALKPSVGLALGDRCRLRASSELVLATKASRRLLGPLLAHPTASGPAPPICREASCLTPLPSAPRR